MSDSSTRAVSRRSFLTSTGVVGAVALAGCTEGPGAEGAGGSGGSTDATGSTLSGSISITGSSTVYPVAQAVTEEFRSEHSEVGFNLARTGTGGGFSNQFCPGNSDFNNASREISSEEEGLCSENGVEYHEVPIATDALTVIVNNENDWVDCMTPDQLRQIWRADGASTWSDVNSEWPDEEINRFGAADTSGTFDYFREAILGEEATHTNDYSATEQDNTILQGVQNDQYGIGYFGFSYYQSNQDAVKALAIDNGDGCVEPSLETAKSGEYAPLSRPLFTYIAKDSLSEEHIAEFARFYVEQSANQDLIAGIGYVPQTEEDMQAELEELNSVIENAQ